MFSSIPSFSRWGVATLTALVSLQVTAFAAPLDLIVDPTVAESSANKPMLVEMGEGRDHGPGYQFWPRVRGGGHWNGGGRHWNGDGNWNRGWGGRHGWRGGHWGRNNWGPAFALGLGFGVPLGYYGGYYDNYNDGYYDQPVYRPRAYRGRAYYNNYRGYNNYRRYDGEESRNHCGNVYMTGPRFFRCDR